MKINHSQLVFAREYRGYSQTELASMISGLSQSNLSKFEKGFGGLSDDILRRIIGHLDFPESFFERKISNNIENAHYRKRVNVSKREKSKIEHGSKLAGYLIDRMAESLEFPTCEIRMIDLDDGYTPEAVAKHARRYLGFGDEPVREINSVLEKNGIIIVEMEDDANFFDGVSFITDEGYPVIVINSRFSNDRKRFTVAHELGHIIMHLSESFIFPDYRNKEDEANRFASEFLMPSDVIENSLRNLNISHLGELKRYWLTSMASLIRRARDLGCITDTKYKNYNIELSRRGHKREEPLSVYIDQPNLFMASYAIHKDELGYSDEELVELFDLPMDVLSRFFHLNENRIKILNYL
jgi:Zn-dependent peptidase ImmA (M78 family)